MGARALLRNDRYLDPSCLRDGDCDPWWDSVLPGLHSVQGLVCHCVLCWKRLGPHWVGILAYNRAMDEEAAMAAEAEANAKLTDEDGNKIDDDGNVTVEMNPAIVPQGYQPSGTLSTTIDGVKQIIHDVKHDKDDEAAKRKALEEEEEQRKADKA